MPAGLPDRALKAVRHVIGLRRHDCSVDGCGRDAVVFPPATCAEHGGLDEAVNP